MATPFLFWEINQKHYIVVLSSIWKNIIALLQLCSFSRRLPLLGWTEKICAYNFSPGTGRAGRLGWDCQGTNEWQRGSAGHSGKGSSVQSFSYPKGTSQVRRCEGCFFLLGNSVYTYTTKHSDKVCNACSHTWHLYSRLFCTFLALLTRLLVSHPHRLSPTPLPPWLYVSAAELGSSWPVPSIIP